MIFCAFRFLTIKQAIQLKLQKSGKPPDLSIIVVNETLFAASYDGLVIVLITVLHFMTPLDQIVWHEIYQRLYYIPIIPAALLYGCAVGLSLQFLQP